MNRNRTIATTTTALVVASMSWSTLLHAQITEVSRTPIADAAQITFGYLCDDNFLIRNDGTRAIDLEYAVEKGNEHTKLNLNARETVQLASKSKEAMELWMDGKLIAKAEKDKRSCKDVQGNGAVNVTPLEVSSTTAQRQNAGYGLPYPFFDPWGFGYYGFGYGSLGYRYPSIVSYPIIIGGGGIHGGGARGGGRRR